MGTIGRTIRHNTLASAVTAGVVLGDIASVVVTGERLPPPVETLGMTTAAMTALRGIQYGRAARLMADGFNKYVVDRYFRPVPSMRKFDYFGNTPLVQAADDQGYGRQVRRALDK